jgi:hypothetical protein
MIHQKILILIPLVCMWQIMATRRIEGQKNHIAESTLEAKRYHGGPSTAEYKPPVIIGVGLPKSGSKSISKFINDNCAGGHAVHWTTSFCPTEIYPIPAVRLPNNVTWPKLEKSHAINGCYIGPLIQRAIADGKKPLEYVLMYGVNAVLQMDVAVHYMSIWPQIDALDLILDAYPDALYIHHTRDTEKQIASLHRWYDIGARMQDHGMLSRFPGQTEHNNQDQNMEIFIATARSIVRKAFLQRPHLHYLEVDFERDQGAGEKMSIFLHTKKLHHITLSHTEPNEARTNAPDDILQVSRSSSSRRGNKNYQNKKRKRFS